MMPLDAKIYVAGHRGMVGSAIVRELQRQGYTNIITRTHAELDLCRQADVERFSLKNVLNMCSSQRLRWAVLWPTAMRSPISCIRI